MLYRRYGNDFVPGNSWGVGPQGGCVGCGPQEEFYGCADVAITSSGGAGNQPSYPSNTPSRYPEWVPSTEPTRQPDNRRVTGGGVERVCRSGGYFRGQASIDQWCAVNCALNYCPETHCECFNAVVSNTETPSLYPDVKECSAFRAAERFAGNSFVENYCQIVCDDSICPNDACACVSGGSTSYRRCVPSDPQLRDLPHMELWCTARCLDNCPPECQCY